MTTAAPRADVLAYLRNADASAREAAETKLPNVRERALRAELRWREMAELAEMVALGSAAREAATSKRTGR